MLLYERLLLYGCKKNSDKKKYSKYIEIDETGDSVITQQSVDRFIYDYGKYQIGRAFMRNYLEFLKLHRELEIPRDRGRRNKGARETAKVKYITKEDTYAFVQKLNIKLALQCLFMFEGGLRISEMLAVRWKNIDLDNRTIEVEHGKNWRRRVVSFTEYTRSLLLVYWEYIPNVDKNDLVFPSQTELRSGRKPENERNVITMDIAKQAKELLGLEVHAHSFRHGCAFELRKQGYPLDEIKVYLGHRSIKSTEIYADVLNAINVLEKVKKTMNIKTLDDGIIQ